MTRVSSRLVFLCLWRRIIKQLEYIWCGFCIIKRSTLYIKYMFTNIFLPSIIGLRLLFGYDIKQVHCYIGMFR